MKRFLEKIIHDEEGAVTVDWVVLTAAIVGLVVLIIASMQNSTVDLSERVSGFLSNWTF